MPINKIDVVHYQSLEKIPIGQIIHVLLKTISPMLTFRQPNNYSRKKKGL